MPSDERDAAVTPAGRFFCSAEWHLQQMKCSLACPLYSWARRISKKSGVFSASVEHVAEYFMVDRKTVTRALKELTRARFFTSGKQSERFKPNTYAVIDHRSWADRNPGRCLVKETLPWEGEGDPLGRQLYAISGQRVKFFPRQMTGLRSLGFADEQISELFRMFIEEASYVGKQWGRAYFDFHSVLKTLAIPEVGVVGIVAHLSPTVRVPSKYPIVSHPSPASSRSREVEAECKIPALRLRPTEQLTESLKKERKERELSSSKISRLQPPPVGLT